MEDKALSDYFKGVIDKAEKDGHPPIVVRASFDRVAPKLAWQHNWMIPLLIMAAVLTGVLIPPVVVLGSLFLAEAAKYYLASLLLGASGFLFYFALSAFNIHEWVKLVFTFIMSLIIGAAAFGTHAAATFALTIFQSKLAEIAPGVAAAQSAGIDIPGASLLTSVFPAPLSLQSLLIIVFVSYNLWPLLFWIKDRFESRQRKKS